MRPVILSVVAVSVFALLAAGCGGGGNSPGVANLGDATTTDTTTAVSAAQNRSGDKPVGGPGPSGHFQIGMMVGTEDGPKFSACMRRHGLPNFPDPNSQGVISISSGMGIDPGSPVFQGARSACAKLLPNGGRPTPAQIVQQQQQLLAFSGCMRAHGVKDFPDPSNGGLRISVHPGSDLDPSNPTFKNAQQACQKYLPFKGGITAKAGGG